MTENIENKATLQDEPYINLVKATEQQISELKAKYDISASAKFLREVGVCLLAEGISANEEILKFFDAIYLSATSRFENTDVSATSLCEGEVKRTLLDLISKYKYLYDTDADKIPFDAFLHASSKYLSTLDICPPSTVCICENDFDLSFTDKNDNSITSFSLDDSRPLPFGYKKSVSDAKSSDLFAQKGDLFILLSLTNTQKDYTAQTNELFEKPDFINAVKTKTVIGCGGVLYALSQLCAGAVIYGDEVGTAESLSNLVSLHEGKLLISTSVDNEESIKSLAEEHSLSAIRVAESSDLLSFTIITSNNKINIRANFLRGLFKYRSTLNEQIPVENFSPARYEKLYVTMDGQTQEACSVVSHKGHFVSTLKTTSCSFTSAINIVLDSVFALLAKGVARKNIGISLKIGCSKNHKERSVAALLGIYRVCVELMIAEKESVVIDSEQDYIFCCAYAKENTIEKPSLAPDEPSGAYLLSFGRFNNTNPMLMPDFSGVRKMCMLLEDNFLNKRVIAARPVNGFVASAAGDLCEPSYSLFPYLNDGINESTRAQGIILRAPIKEKIKAPMIGVIRKG